MQFCDTGCSGKVSDCKDHSMTITQRICTSFARFCIRLLKCNLNLTTLLLVVSTILTCLIYSNLNQLTIKVSKVASSRGRSCLSHNNPSTYRQAWIRADHQETGYLKHVSGVLKSLKFSLDGGTYSDWELLWSHDYPFTDSDVKKRFIGLKPHQKVNKIPGSGFVTSKVSLATSVLKNVPKAFKIPADEAAFRQYAKDNPKALWVQKSNNHRGIRITPVEGLDLSNSGTFVQQYVDKPLIIDKRKFDIGVYAIITSIEPLRIYIVNHELLLRFCAHDYYPFDTSDRDKYVVTDDYTPIWEIPSLNKFYHQGFTAKQSLYQHMKDSGLDADKVFLDIEETIRDVYLSKISMIRETAAGYNKRNFFEMVRFDFVLDDVANLYLMEVNMSPNLSSNHFAPNRILYEQVLYNLFHLVGLAGAVDHSSKLESNEEDMIAGPRDISADPVECSSQCSNGCLASVCKLCYPCMTTSERHVFQEAYTEHSSRRNTKRVFPPSMKQKNLGTKPQYWQQLTDADKVMHMWFEGKCKNDVTWC